MIKQFFKVLGVFSLAGVFVAGLFLYNIPRPANAVEIPSLRTLTSRTVDNGDGTTTWQGSQGSIHYLNAQGNLVPIDNGITANGSMLSDAYNFRVLQNRFNFGRIIQYSVNGCTVELQPMNLEYINDLNQIQPISAPQNVIGAYSNETAPIFSNPNNHIGKVTYANAYGTGINMSWGLDAGRITKLLTIQNMSNLPVPTNTTMNGGNPSMRLSFIFAHSNNISVYLDNTIWGEGTQPVNAGSIDFRLSTNQTVMYFLPITYYDSSSERLTYTSNATLRRSGQSLYIEAKVPISWLQSATFPVFIDPSASAQVGASNQDCQVTQSGSGAWEWELPGLPWIIQPLTYADSTWGCVRYNIINNSGIGTYDIEYHNGGGFVFPSVGLDNGVTVTEAHFIVTPKYNNGSTTVNARITGNKVGNAAVWSTLANYQARRGTAVGGANNDNRTAANVTWDNIAADVVDTAKNSPDIASVVQEIVNLGSWANGNNMAFWIDDHEGRSSQTSGVYRSSYSWDSSTSKCLQLSVTYTGGGGTPAIPDDDTDLIMFLSLPFFKKN